MTEDEIQTRETEMRKEFPASFDHPELRPGEMYIGDWIPEDAPEAAVEKLKEQGRHARLGLRHGHFGARPFFVNIRETILAEAKANA